MLVTLTFMSAIIGSICSCLLVLLRARAIRQEQSHEGRQKRMSAELEFRDALLAESEEAMVVLPNAFTPSYAIRNGGALLRSCMEGGNSRKLAEAIEGLIRQAANFDFVAGTADGRAASLRGRMVDRRAVLYIRDLGEATTVDIDYRAVLDAMPIPAWVRDADLNLQWANAAFLEAVGATRLQDAIAANAKLGRSECELAAAARDDARSVSARRDVLIGAEHRTLSFSLSRLSNAGVAGFAVDVTDAVQAETMLGFANEATNDMLDGLAHAVAIFGRDQRLETANAEFRRMWSLSEDWLATHPTLGAVYDLLRETRQLPEQRDFQKWKCERLKRFEPCADAHEELWHIPCGRSLKVVARPHLLGGIYVIFEDITAQMRLEASFKLLTQVQRATLDIINQGTAIFGPDGRLLLHNTSFAKLWRLTDDELTGQPHISRVSCLAEARVGRDELWSIVSVGLTSGEPERCSEWGKTTRADGRIISLTMSRLPDGATAVTFNDLTDREGRSEIDVRGDHVAA